MELEFNILSSFEASIKTLSIKIFENDLGVANKKEAGNYIFNPKEIIYENGFGVA